MLVNEVEYNYSYVLAQKSLTTSDIKKSQEISLDDQTLYYSKDMDITYLEIGNDSITVLGYIMDIRNGSLNNNEIVDLLLSSEDLDKNLDYINGRYIMDGKFMNIDSEMDFKMYYERDYKTSSWKKAGKIQIKEVDQ